MSHRFVSLAAVFAAIALTGCQSDLPVERLKAGSEWSKAICACAALPTPAEGKACADKIKRPADPGAEVAPIIGGPKYKLDGLLLLNSAETPGMECQGKILVTNDKK